VDLSALVVNEKQRRFKSYLIDVKKDVGGEDGIYHLIDQWKDSMLHMETLTLYYRDYISTQCIGVITRHIDYDRVREAIEKKEAMLYEYDQGAKTLSLLKAAPNFARIQQELDILKKFEQGEFMDWDGSHRYEVFFSEACGDEWCYELQYRM